ncbi:Glycosyl transferase family 2 [Muriicola jejuensis]|uniref:Glycosyltransferase n=1 Tax=Muriicola jejuensis TaxID=504488 RepID=A0A6P0UH25_9FLAO|nr:glycosyltransferase family A protein [Muriicola jejuensis]NER10473.1 glycosyltransferase [Muriicola jejuensis]SMP18586.1 Glycosyl transferase family 2 [Muriicola jejuensis]
MSQQSNTAYYIVIPAHNEELYLADALESVVNQSLPPKKVVVVNDHSTDGTSGILEVFTKKYSFIQSIDKESSDEHLPGSKVVAAFNTGLGLLDEEYDFLVKLDADTILPADYFERIASLFSASEKIGIAGGFAYERNKKGQWELNHPMDKDHVRGAFKAYSKSCFKAIGGLREAMGWDTVDELLARFHGFEVRTDNTLHVKHQRPIGDAYNAKARRSQGRAMYLMRYGLLISSIASLKMAWKNRKVRILVDNLSGYWEAKKRKQAYIVTPEEGKFIRNLRWQRIFGKLI